MKKNLFGLLNKIKLKFVKTTGFAIILFFGIGTKKVFGSGSKVKLKENTQSTLEVVELKNPQQKENIPWSQGKGSPFKIGVVDPEMITVLELEKLLGYLSSNLKMLSNIPVPKIVDQKKLLLYRSGSDSNEKFNFQKIPTNTNSLEEKEKLKEERDLMSFFVHLISVVVLLRKKRPFLFGMVCLMLISLTLISVGYYSPLFFISQAKFQGEELKPILNEKDFLSKLEKIKESARGKIQKDPAILKRDIEVTEKQIQKMERRKRILEKKLKKQQMEKKFIEEKLKKQNK